MNKASFKRSNQMRDFYNSQEVTKRLQAKANEITERHAAMRGEASRERVAVGATIEGVNECDAS